MCFDRSIVSHDYSAKRCEEKIMPSRSKRSGRNLQIMVGYFYVSLLLHGVTLHHKVSRCTRVFLPYAASPPGHLSTNFCSTILRENTNKISLTLQMCAHDQGQSAVHNTIDIHW